jgi:hypothetical protein
MRLRESRQRYLETIYYDLEPIREFNFALFMSLQAAVFVLWRRSNLPSFAKN